MFRFDRPVRFVISLITMFAVVCGFAPTTSSAQVAYDSSTASVWQQEGLGGYSALAAQECQVNTSTSVSSVLVIDVSGSMNRENRIGAARRGAQEYVEAESGSTDELAVVTFGNAASAVVGLRPATTRDQQNDIKAQIAEIAAGGVGTNIAAGVNAAIGALSNAASGNSKAIVLLTDGVPEGPEGGFNPTLYAEAQAAANRAGRAGIPIYTIGLALRGLGEFEDEASRLLQEMATVTRGRFERSETGANLPAIYREINRSTRQCKGRSEPANITVVQRPNPNMATTPGSLVTYTIVVTNRDKGLSSNTTITMPFAPTEAQVVDATFSRQGAWVSKLLTDTLELQTGPIGANDVVTATVRLRTLAALPAGTSLGERLSFRWRDNRGGGASSSNMTMLASGPANVNSEFYPMTATPASGPIGTKHVFTSAVFAPNEPVTVWYNMPAGRVVPVGTFLADANGQLSVELVSATLPGGRYSMVARGQWTEFTAVTGFDVD